MTTFSDNHNDNKKQLQYKGKRQVNIPSAKIPVVKGRHKEDEEMTENKEIDQGILNHTTYTRDDKMDQHQKVSKTKVQPQVKTTYDLKHQEENKETIKNNKQRSGNYYDPLSDYEEEINEHNSQDNGKVHKTDHETIYNKKKHEISSPENNTKVIGNNETDSVKINQSDIIWLRENSSDNGKQYKNDHKNDRRYDNTQKDEQEKEAMFYFENYDEKRTQKILTDDLSDGSETSEEPSSMNNSSSEDEYSSSTSDTSQDSNDGKTQQKVQKGKKT